MRRRHQQPYSFFVPCKRGVILCIFLTYCSIPIVTSNCPPSIVSSFEELHEYCPDVSSEDGHYECYKHNRVVCQGTIDHRHSILPLCQKSSTIRDCSDEQYYHVCARGHHKNCGKDDFTFVGWDKQQPTQWCQGFIEPDLGTPTHPVCPSSSSSSKHEIESFYDCGILYRYGIHVERDCDCFTSIFGGPIQFECRDSNGHVWCSYRSSLFGKSSWSTTSYSSSSHRWSFFNAMMIWESSSPLVTTTSTVILLSSLVLLTMMMIMILTSIVRRRQQEEQQQVTWNHSNSQVLFPHEGTALL